MSLASPVVKARPLLVMRCISQHRVPLTVSFTVSSRWQAHTADFPPSCRNRAGLNRDLAMISLDFDFNILTRDLSHYLENQVKVGLFGSGVGLSLVLGFSAAYTCYYLILVAKVRKSNSLKFVCPVRMQARLTEACSARASARPALLLMQDSIILHLSTGERQRWHVRRLSGLTNKCQAQYFYSHPCFKSASALRKSQLC